MFYKNPQNRVNITFLFFTLSIALWDFVEYLFDTSPNRDVAYFWSLFFPLVVPLSIPAVYFLILAITENWTLVKSFFTKTVVIGGTSLFILTGLLAGVTDQNIFFVDGHWSIRSGKLPLSLFTDNGLIVWGIIIIISALVVLVRYLRSNYDPLRKKQLKLMLYGIIISLVLDLVNSFTWVSSGKADGIANILVLVISYVSLPLMISFFAYAIIKYDMFSINASTAAEMIFTKMADAVFLLDSKLKLVLMNKAAKTMAINNLTVKIGASVDKFLKSSQSDQRISKIIKENLLENQKIEDFEAQLISEPNIPVSVSISFIDEKAGLERGVVCIVRDISERKTQELRLKSSFDSLKLADKQIQLELARLKTIISSIGEGLIVLDYDSKVIFNNDRAMEILKMPEVDLNNQDVSKLFTISTETGELINIDKKMREKFRKNSALRYTTSDSVYITTYNKERVPINLTATAFTLGTEVDGAIIIFEDITKEMAIDKTKSEFVSLAAHQLRTPLTAIKWNLDLLEVQLEKKGTPAIKKLMDSTQSVTENMSEMVKQFLNVSRIELGKISVKPEKLDLNILVKEVTAEQIPSAQIKLQKLRVKYDKALPKIMLDKTLTRAVVQNLLSNAVKYTPENGKINISLIAEKDNALISIEDSGMGIPKEQQQKLFSKLFRADNAVKSGTEGTGLGLYIVKAIVKLAGGEIWFESKENIGTTFHVTLPYSGMKEKEGSRGLG